MATSIYGTTDHTYIQVAVDWSVNWQDADSNRTSLHVELWARRTNTGYTTSGMFSGGLKIDGVNRAGVDRQVAITSAWLKLTEYDIEIVHNADGYRSVALSAYGAIPGTGWNSTSVSGTAVLDRLWAAPPLPTVVTPQWDLDTQFTVGITHGTPSPRGEILSTQLQRRRISTPATDWASIMDASGAVTSFADTGVTTNAAFQYRAGVWNWRAQIGWRESATAYTTPGAPTSVTAAKKANLSITVSWVSGAAYTPAHFEIRDNGVLVATVAGSTSSWTHTSPDAGVTHTYTVRAVQGSLGSAWVASDTVQLLTPPLAPSNLSPSGTNTLTGSVTLSWTHNPVDSSPQSAANIRYRIVGAGTWTTTTATTSQQVQRTLTVGNYEWQVQTRGAHASFGAWSAVATFSVVAAPTVTITGPASPLSSSVATAVWTWAQAQGLAQTAWTAVLETPSGTVIETRSGTGATASTTFVTRLTDASNYVVRVTATNGVLTATSTRAFTTLFVPPPAPILTAVWDDVAGVALIHVAKGAGTPATVSLDVDRSTDGGTTWEPVVTGLAPVATQLNDGECLSNGVTLYRCTAWTATPSAATTQITLAADSGAVWLSGGAGFQTCVKLPLNPSTAIEAGRKKAMVQYTGRELPVPYSGRAKTRTITASGTFFHRGGAREDRDALDTSLDAVVALAQDPRPLHLYRNPDGLRVYGQLSAVSVSRPPAHGVWKYSVTLTETVKS